MRDAGSTRQQLQPGCAIGETGAPIQASWCKMRTDERASDPKTRVESANPLSSARMDAATPSPRIALVVPCFNEADRLDAGEWIAFARERADRRLCFVDDGSTDATAARLAEIAAAVPDRIDVE